jgi:hypothetical protein
VGPSYVIRGEAEEIHNTQRILPLFLALKMEKESHEPRNADSLQKQEIALT